MKAKRIFFLVALAIFIGTGLFITLFNKSSQYLDEAEELYRQRNYAEAKVMIIKALKANRYNRGALALQSKVNVILKGEGDYQRGKALFDKAVDQYENGDVEEARATFGRAYEILANVSTASAAKAKANDLIRTMARYLKSIEQKGPTNVVDSARGLLNSGKYMQAFTQLEKMPDSVEVRNLKSEAAYIIGSNRFESVIRRKDSVSEIEVNDAIYWLKNVHTGYISYRQSQIMIQELEKLR